MKMAKNRRNYSRETIEIFEDESRCNPNLCLSDSFTIVKRARNENPVAKGTGKKWEMVGNWAEAGLMELGNEGIIIIIPGPPGCLWSRLPGMCEFPGDSCPPRQLINSSSL